MDMAELQYEKYKTYTFNRIYIPLSLNKWHTELEILNYI